MVLRISRFSRRLGDGERHVVGCAKERLELVGKGLAGGSRFPDPVSAEHCDARAPLGYESAELRAHMSSALEPVND
jgi:hypothetical protein